MCQEAVEALPQSSLSLRLHTRKSFRSVFMSLVITIRRTIGVVGERCKQDSKMPANPLFGVEPCEMQSNSHKLNELLSLKEFYFVAQVEDFKTNPLNRLMSFSFAFFLSQKCCLCSKVGATLQCGFKQCRDGYHFVCAKQRGLYNKTYYYYSNKIYFRGNILLERHIFHFFTSRWFSIFFAIFLNSCFMQNVDFILRIKILTNFRLFLPNGEFHHHVSQA